MTRNAASAKSIGGGGYLFDHRVIAWWCLHMLAGRSPLGTNSAGPPPSDPDDDC